jgi:hypothetical protein
MLTTHRHLQLRQKLGTGTLLLHEVALVPGAPVLAAMVVTVAPPPGVGLHLLKGQRTLQLYVLHGSLVLW